MSPRSRLAVSVVIPVRNGVDALTRCLAAVHEQLGAGDEIVVVDDYSTEDVASVAERFGAAVVRLERHCGVAAARNRGAERATRPILLFVDADVVVRPGIVEQGLERMNDSRLDAVIGSYDDNPAAPTLVSRFKNLAHHYFHQRAGGPIGSFWSACGFIRRELFHAVGGFDERRFARPSIEDVELGWRITDRGGRIVLDPALQVTHLKRWTLGSLIVTDVMYRAVPWVRWSLQRRRLSGELNVSPVQQIAALVSVGVAVTFIAIIRSDVAVIPFVLCVAAALFINYRLFQLFWRKGGVRLLAAGFALQQLYYLCALTGAALGVATYYWPARRSVSAPPARVGC
jgi:GT2 family glycosyltransferase